MSDIMKQYVVCGPGRCGGHLLTGLILATGAKAERTHDLHHKVDDHAATIWIDVDRKEIFDAVCSNIVANRTGQTTNYPHIAVPFYTSRDEFTQLYQVHLNYREHKVDRRNFAGHHCFWYEDFAQNWQVVWDRLQIVPDPIRLKEDLEILGLINQPAPYNYRDIIINYQELREWLVY